MLLLAPAAALTLAVLWAPYPGDALSPDNGGPLVVTDRRGRVLRRVPSPDGRPGRDAWVPIDRIASHAVLALVGSEDRRFFEHAGVDPGGLARAAWLDLKSGSLAYGGSTITMQLMRMVHHPNRPRSFANKIEEAVLALRAERDLDKRQILEQYLNRAYYGRGAYGIEAAARTYFGKPAASLSSGEATLLAVIPRGPSYYDPVDHLDRALRRRRHVLGLLVAQGAIGAREAARIEREPVKPVARRPEFEAPHFVQAVLASLPGEVKRRGGMVRTSLDLDLQKLLERRLAEHVASLDRQGLEQAGLVVLDTRNGEVLAMVGSPDFGEEQGQLNITTTRRHPGSSLKPFVYAMAIEDGDTPATIAYDILDVESEYRARKPTQPERGPVRYREALAGSYNLAAVHVLEKVGADRLITRLRRAGVGEVPGLPRDYGLRLALGATKVRLVDLAAAYTFIGRDGTVVRPRLVLESVPAGGVAWKPPLSTPSRLFSPQTAWLTMSMLSDPDARRPAFGADLPVDDMPFPIALKTGTARGFADTVAVGVTREVVVASWAGNFSGRPTQGLVAMNAAAPLVRAGMMAAANGRKLSLPEKPAGIVAATVCALSGRLATGDCPAARLEHFATGTAPADSCAWHGRRAGRVTVSYPDSIAKWAGRATHVGGRGI